ncbi:GNAT family N-acetyltransferase [Nocardia sp. PE-7]|uniref:GNAT family N-acetyltransferase n=1 Tax=Nocardia sp. PE-7 TaxID=3058426 RepID=UPI0026587521|nr:GNAT family N-acetyltransferase [Nocardia sp. PE-7]WKG09784.1 GNAT family N-acetyltransferase [Nocardia sp. PE-7]
MTRFVRAASAADAEAAAGLLTELHAHFEVHRPADIVRRTRRLTQNDYSTWRPAPLLIVEDETPLGFATYQLDEPAKWGPGGLRISEFLITESARGTGAGAILLAELQEVARAAGVSVSEPNQAAPEVFTTVERYIGAHVVNFAFEKRRADHWSSLRAEAAEKGWPAPQLNDLWHTELHDDPEIGHLYAEGEVPFILLPDGRVVTARFRTIYVKEYLGHGPENRWTLALSGSELRSVGGGLEIDHSWSRAENRPALAVPIDDGRLMVNYSYYASNHFGSDQGTIDYLIDLVEATASQRAHVTFEED